MTDRSSSGCRYRNHTTHIRCPNRTSPGSRPDDLPEPHAGPDALAEKGLRWKWSRRLAERRVADRHPDADYAAVLQRMRANYYGMLQLIDDQLERFVNALETEGRWHDTLLVCTSGHGDFAGEYGLMRKGVGALPEATTRVPLLVHGPDARSSHGPCSAHVSLVDLLPTLCSACDVDVPQGVQGRNLWPLLAGATDRLDGFGSVYAEADVGGNRRGPDDAPPIEEASPNELNPITQSGTTAMVRKNEVKLVFDADGRRQLYDLSTDPAGLADRYDDSEYADARMDLLETPLTCTLSVRNDTSPLSAPDGGPNE
jgi:arylsulfatase A-like enzyme